MSVIPRIEYREHPYTGEVRSQNDCLKNGDPSDEQTCILLYQQADNAAEDDVTADDQQATSSKERKQAAENAQSEQYKYNINLIYFNYLSN